MRRIFIAIFALCIVSVQFNTVEAQDNLLTNPGFEPPYADVYQREVANGWTPWFSSGNPEWFDEAYSLKRSGSTSQGIMGRWEVFIGGLYQQVSGLQPGTVVRAQVFGTIYVAGSDDYAASRSRIRIGLDPNGGTNPSTNGIAWSGEINSSAAQQTGEISYQVPYTPLTVETTVTNGTVTLFLWGTQDYPAEEQRQLWDDASLIIVGQGNTTQPTAEGGNPSGAASPVPPIPNGVVRQGAQADGSIVHVVESGQTLTGIAIAYGVPIEQIVRLNNIVDVSLLFVGQELVIVPVPGSEAEVRLTVQPTDVPPPTQAPVQPTQVAQVAPTDPPANTGPGTPTLFPTPTNTPTALPTAPVITAEVDSENVQNGTSSICVSLYDDLNQNRIKDADEPLLPGGTIVLHRDSTEVSRVATLGLTEIYCFEDLLPGEFIASATAPDDYGLTTPAQFRVRPQAGDRLTVAFGAAEGYEPPAAPVGNVAPLNQVTVDNDANVEDEPLEQVLQYLGIIVLGLAGLLLVGGGTTALLMRRR